MQFGRGGNDLLCKKDVVFLFLFFLLFQIEIIVEHGGTGNLS